MSFRFRVDHVEEPRHYVGRDLVGFGDVFFDDSLTFLHCSGRVAELTLNSTLGGELLTLTLARSPDDLFENDLFVGGVIHHLNKRVVPGQAYDRRDVIETIRSLCPLLVDNVLDEDYSRRHWVLTSLTSKALKQGIQFKSRRDRYPKGDKFNQQTILITSLTTPLWSKIFAYTQTHFPHLKFARFDTQKENLQHLDTLFYIGITSDTKPEDHPNPNEQPQDEPHYQVDNKRIKISM